MLGLIKNNRTASALVLFSGVVFSVMAQLNWLYLVRNDSFEKNETIRMFLSPLGAIIIFILWFQYITLLKKTLNNEIIDKIIFKDSISMLTLLGSLHILWSPPMNHITLHGILLACLLIKVILYPKEIILVGVNIWKILFQEKKENIQLNYSTLPKLNNKNIFILVLFIILVSALCYMWLTINKVPAQTDEEVHFEQITKFLNGDFTRHSAITMIPGYHLIVSTFLYLFKLDSFNSARFISLFLALTSVYLFFNCIKIIHSRVAIQRTLAFFCLPILFPFHFLVYTDAVSLMFILMGFYLYFQRRLNLCALALGVSVLIRQPNIMWVVMIFLVEYIENNGLTLRKRQILDHIQKNILLFYIIVDFALFVIMNGGRISLATDHQPTIRTENVFFSLFVFFFLFFPFVISKLLNSIKYVIKKIYLFVPIIFLFFLYLSEFQVVHKYNIIGGNWLHNMIPLFIVKNDLHKIISFIPILIAAVSLLRFQLYSKSMHVFYPIWFLSLIPLGLIEMRYYIPHMTLFLLFKKTENNRLEWFQSFHLIIISVIICYLFIGYGFFP